METKLPSLYALSEEVAAVLADDSEESLAKLEALLPDLQHKAAHVARWICYQEDLAAAIREREKLVVAARKEMEAKAERWRRYLVDAMNRVEASEITDTQTGTTIKLVLNPPAVVIDDPGEIPSEFLRQAPPPPPAPDKKAILATIKDGFDVPGAHMEQSCRLEIK